MAKRKLKWSDTEDIAFQLIDKYPSVDPLKLSPAEIGKRVTNLPDFGAPAKTDDESLNAIQKIWSEERADMEDELGPVTHDEFEDDELDEDEYRSERMIDDDLGFEEDDDDEDDEDELDDGFHEEEAEDERER